jgi:hypothetical protein
MKWLALIFTAGLALAESPQLTNARFETRPVTGDGQRYMEDLVAHETGPLWVGYAVDSSQPDNNSCCWNNNVSCGCRLEGGSGGVSIQRTGEPIKLEGSRTLFVLYRVQDHAITKVRSFSASCPLDAGGLRFVWLTGVSAQASIQFLSTHVKQEKDSALVAIAMHAGEAADQALERFAEPSNGEQIQEKALFWLANSRGERGLKTVLRVAQHDPSDHIREKTMFDLSLSKEPAAIDALINSAKHDSSARVREQALFWLAQKAGAKAVGEIKNSIDNDPDTEVKKKAVFALQQLPEGEGVPLLIEVAKTNRNAEVRKQAMFWLGQCHDPRALAFFQEVLAR